MSGPQLLGIYPETVGNGSKKGLNRSRIDENVAKTVMVATVPGPETLGGLLRTPRAEGSHDAMTIDLP